MACGYYVEHDSTWDEREVIDDVRRDEKLSWSVRTLRGYELK